MHIPHPSRRRIQHLRTDFPLFRIFYSGTFFLAVVVLGALLLITPGDHIYQALKSKQIYHILVVAGVYLLTFLVSMFIYASRLFKTRSALAAIPRELHLADGANVDGRGRKIRYGQAHKQHSTPMVLGVKVNHRVRGVVRNGLNRSAIIAYEGRPRNLRKDPLSYQEIPALHRKKRRRWGIANVRSSEDAMHAAEPIWGVVAHPGWSSPCSLDLSDIQYEQVIIELPNLIEAKAVSLAPVDPFYDPHAVKPQATTSTGAEEQEPDAEDTPPLDPLIVTALTRPVAMTLRDYLAHLTSLDMIPPLSLETKFVDLYERARFSGRPLREAEFRTLMSLFAELLRQMQPISEAAAEEIRNAEAAAADTDDIDGEGAGGSVTGSVRRRSITADDDAASIGSTGTVNRHPPRGEEPSPEQAPYRKQTSRQPSALSQAKTSVHPRRHASSAASASASSLQRKRTLDSLSNAGSVIRLTDAQESLDLPYAYVTRSRSRSSHEERLNE